MSDDELRKLDAEIATQLMGWKVLLYVDAREGDLPLPCAVWCPLPYSGGEALRLCPPFTADNWSSHWWIPTEDIQAAWLVVEQLSALGHGLVLESWKHDPKHSDRWAALFDLKDGHDTGQCVAKTAPLAICLAARLVIRARVKGT